MLSGTPVAELSTIAFSYEREAVYCISAMKTAAISIIFKFSRSSYKDLVYNLQREFQNSNIKDGVVQADL